MTENRNILLRSAMNYGLSMGIFWLVKYIFYVLGINSNLMSFIYLFLTGLVPLVAYFFTFRYKLDIGGQIRFLHAWQFGILLYFFAAVVVSLAHYAFYEYLAPPGFLANSLQQTVDLLKSADVDPQMLESISGMHLSSIGMALQGILNNVFYGIILSLPVAYILSRKAIPQHFVDAAKKLEDNNEDE